MVWTTPTASPSARRAICITEAGRGGSEFFDGVSFGLTSSLSRYRNGLQERILTGLPSRAGADGSEAAGLQDIAFDSSGQAFGLIGLGLGTDPAARATSGLVGTDLLGHLVRLSLDGSLPAVQSVADVAAFEAANDPDGGGVDSNPYGLVAGIGPGGGCFGIADAGGNTLLEADPLSGAVSLLATFPAQPNPLFPLGPPFYESVPTAAALGPDGALYISQLTGFPFLPGAASIYRYDFSTGQTTVALTGFTNVVDLTFGADGSLYVLEYDADGIFPPIGPGTNGALLQVNLATGARQTILTNGLVAPTSVVAGKDGALYVSNYGSFAGQGQVLRIAQTIPEPGSAALLGAGLLPLVGVLQQRKRRR